MTDQLLEADNEEPPTLLEGSEESEENFPKVPLTIITGFLGAGKSTLLQYVLNAQHGYRIAVIMNEFTDSADIEARTINVTSAEDPSSLSEEVLELANGCLCCSIKDSGAAAIEKLMKKRGRFDYILLETTGLADPGPIARMFWDNEGMSDSIYLDGVVCMVDGLNGLKTLGSPERDLSIGARQIACADVILLSKFDIAKTQSLDETERIIRKLNATAPVSRISKGRVDNIRSILNLNAYSSAPFPQWREDPSPHDHDHHHDHDEGRELEHEHEHEHDHFDGITSIVIPLPPFLSASQVAKLDEWLRTLLWEGRLLSSARETSGEPQDPNHVEILRCKGVYTTHEKRTFVIQGVRDLYDVQEIIPTSLAQGDGLPGKLALIGKLRGPIAESLRETLGCAIEKP